MLDYIITANVDRAINIFIEKRFTLKPDIEYQNKFKALPKLMQRDIMYSILRTQGESILESFNNRKDVTLPSIGTFTYSENSKRKAILRDKLSNDAGYESFRDIQDTEIKQDIAIKANEQIKNTLVQEKIDKTVNGKSYAPAKVADFSYFLNKKE